MWHVYQYDGYLMQLIDTKETEPNEEDYESFGVLLIFMNLDAAEIAPDMAVGRFDNKSFTIN